LSDLSQYAGFDDAIALLSDYSLPAVLIISPGVEQDSAIRQIASRIGQMDEISMSAWMKTGWPGWIRFVH
jgi:cell division transport system permease protein